MKRRLAVVTALACAVAVAVPTVAQVRPIDPSTSEGVPTVVWGGVPWLALPGVASSDPRGGPVTDSSEAVWVDAAGQLHLKLIPTAGGLAGPHLVGAFQPSYGTYRWTIERTNAARLDPLAVLGLYTYSTQSSSDAARKREIDIETSQFGDRRAPNTQYVVQPYWESHHRVRFPVRSAPGTVTEQFTWMPGSVSFTTWSGTALTPKTLLRRFAFSGADVPTPGGTTLNMNLWWFGLAGSAPTPGRALEAVLTGFTFTPAPGTLPLR